VCLWFAQDKDGRLYLYRELYQTGLLVEDAAKEINRLTGNEQIRATICDHDAEDRATLERYGIPTIPAKKDVKMGIQAVQTRLRKAGDGKPRLYVFSDCLVEPDKKLLEAKQPTCLIEEMEEYVWELARDGVADKETPRKIYDHSEDCLRYLCLYLEKAMEAPIRVSLR
jgi:phage terminase large subunit